MTNETQTTNPIKTTKRRRWFRFRLRTLLIMVTVLTLPLGWVGWELDQRRREKVVVAWVEKMGGEVDFSSFSPMNERSWWEETKDKWFGEQVSFVDLEDTQVSDLSPLVELKNLAVLYLDDTQVSELLSLGELKNLEWLSLNATQVSDLSPLAGLKNLELLYLSHTQMSDLSPLAELKNLKWLSLNAHVSDEQLQELRMALPKCKIYQSHVLQNDD